MYGVTGIGRERHRINEVVDQVRSEKRSEKSIPFLFFFDEGFSRPLTGVA